MPDLYRIGEFRRICDVCGFDFPASKTFKRWDGLMVCASDFETRHPQDFVRGRMDRQRVPEPRPEATDVFVGPTQTVTTAEASAGATSISVESSSGMSAGHTVGIMLSTGNVHAATLQAVPDGTSLTLTAATKLPHSAPLGSVIVDYSTITTPTYS